MNFLGIVWNTTYKNYLEIEKIILEYGKIINSYDLDLMNDDFISFIDSLYDYPKNEKWRSNYKINDLIIYEDKKIRVFEILILNLEMIINKKGVLVNKTAQELKDRIREKFNYTEINGERKEIYIENSFHLSDNEEEYIRQKLVANSYRHLSYIKKIKN